MSQKFKIRIDAKNQMNLLDKFSEGFDAMITGLEETKVMSSEPNLTWQDKHIYDLVQPALAEGILILCEEVVWMEEQKQLTGDIKKWSYSLEMTDYQLHGHIEGDLTISDDNAAMMFKLRFGGTQ